MMNKIHGMEESKGKNYFVEKRDFTEKLDIEIRGKNFSQAPSTVCTRGSYKLGMPELFS